MKSIICMIMFLFCGFAFASVHDVDVGDKTSTIQVETIKHQIALENGFEFVTLNVQEHPDGNFLVIKYQKNDCQFVYCSLNILERIDPGRIVTQLKNKSVKPNQNDQLIVFSETKLPDIDQLE